MTFSIIPLSIITGCRAFLNVTKVVDIFLAVIARRLTAVQVAPDVCTAERC